MGRVLSVIAEKGGAGKTTLATNLATVLHRSGDSVLLVDCDPQHTAYSWSRLESGADRPQTVTAKYRTLLTDVRDTKDEFDWIVIDNAPGVSDNMMRALGASDAALIPTRPGVDLWATNTTAEAVRAVVQDGHPLRAAIVLTQVIHGTVLGRAVAERLLALDLPLMDTRVEMRVSYGEALITGVSVLDTADKKARKEMQSLAEEVKGLWQN